MIAGGEKTQFRAIQNVRVTTEIEDYVCGGGECARIGWKEISRDNCVRSLGNSGEEAKKDLQKLIEGYCHFAAEHYKPVRCEPQGEVKVKVILNSFWADLIRELRGEFSCQ